MKVFISADIEGVTGVTNWTETELVTDNYFDVMRLITFADRL